MIESSISRKVAMALSGLFLILFLAQHFTINFTSVISEDLFNKLSHFMGTNPLVQFILQPILIFGVIFHFVMGFILEIKNRRSRKVNYSYQSGISSSWISRNMFFSGIVILSFLGLHFYDFWVPEIKYKYIEFLPDDSERYYEELIHKFHNPTRVAFYSISFVFLSLHLMHGFASSFQSVGVNNKYSNTIKTIAIAFSVLVPLGFIFIAIFHYLNG
jgi:succinate dehydrogenase / fumarate reductase cytochrome b subunit|tara:strand:- start:2773 stop:3420 length:648 start_codon:yes stop_codon:yes gene_type:complete